MGLHTQLRRQMLKRFRKKVVILKETQNDQVIKYTEPQKKFFSAGGIDQLPEKIINERRQDQQENKAPIPPTIKQITGKKDQDVLNPQIFPGNEPVKKKEDDKKNEKG
jgi:hypothetical protein